MGRGVVWAGVMAVLVVVAFLVPYTALSGVDAWYGSFLFWVVFALGVIWMMVAITRGWRD